MPRHRFALVLDRLPSRAQLETICELGSGGVDITRDAGVPVLECRWTAPNLAAAITAAVQEVEAVGVRALRVASGDWVTLGEIADRIGRSRETVRLWAVGRQGPGGFPPPINPGRYASFYSWAEVAPWLRERMGYLVPDDEPVLAVANLTVQLRALVARLPEAEPVLALLNFGPG